MLSGCSDGEFSNTQICLKKLSYELPQALTDDTEMARNSWRRCVRKESYLLHRSAEELEKLAGVVVNVCQRETNDLAVLLAKRKGLSENEVSSSASTATYQSAYYHLVRARAGNCDPLHD
jgi:hypothetical protein